MKVAEFLSDLTSLEVCDPKAALAVVTARPAQPRESHGTASSSQDDTDLKRAKDLLELHANVKLAHRDGLDEELNAAREAVAKVLRDL